MMCSTTSATKFRWSNVCAKHRKSATKEWSLGGNFPGIRRCCGQAVRVWTSAGGWVVFRVFLADRSLEEEWAAAADHVRLLQGCGNSVLVYGEEGKDS